MDDLDRIFHRLVSNIRHRHSEYLTLPFTVQELYETLIPYRHHRRELGIETNQDYEIAMTRLLSGERDYLHTDPAMRDKLVAELKSPHMDPGAFREFANAKVSLAPEALRRIRALTAAGSEAAPAAGAPGAAQPGQGRGEPVSSTAPTLEAPLGGAAPGTDPSAARSASATTGGTRVFPIASPAASPSVSPAPSPADPARTGATAFSSMMNVAVPEGCRFCGGTLPEGRNVVYCPHCGNNLSVSRCPACGSELERGWKFCVTCGRSVGS